MTTCNHVGESNFKAKASKRNYLSLKKKVLLIEAHPGMALGEMFECGKTQVGQILKKKEELSMYESNAIAGGRIHTNPPRPSEFLEVNKALHNWYTITCSKNMYPGGPQLIEKAKQIAECLGKTNFSGSRGWINRWKKRYNIIKMLKICGESGDVSGETVESWKERLPEIVISHYSKDDIIIESGFFWQALPDTGFGQKGKQCHGGKNSKMRLTVALFVSAAGKKEMKPIVIP